MAFNCFQKPMRANGMPEPMPIMMKIELHVMRGTWGMCQPSSWNFGLRKPLLAFLARHV